MESLTEIINLVSGTAGALVLLVLLSWALISGKLYTQTYVDLLNHSYDELADANESTQQAIQQLINGQEEDLARSETMLDILQKLRDQKRPDEAGERHEFSE